MYRLHKIKRSLFKNSCLTKTYQFSLFKVEVTNWYPRTNFSLRRFHLFSRETPPCTFPWANRTLLFDGMLLVNRYQRRRDTSICFRSQECPSHQHHRAPLFFALRVQGRVQSNVDKQINIRGIISPISCAPAPLKMSQGQLLSAIWIWFESRSKRVAFRCYSTTCATDLFFSATPLISLKSYLFYFSAV